MKTRTGLLSLVATVLAISPVAESQAQDEQFIQERVIAPLALPDTFCMLAADDTRRPRVSSTTRPKPLASRSSTAPAR